MFTLKYNTACKISKQNSLYLSPHKMTNSKKLIFLNFSLFTISYMEFCYFYIAKNIQYFELLFFARR
jgi:hypothetical protein